MIYLEQGILIKFLERILKKIDDPQLEEDYNGPDLKRCRVCYGETLYSQAPELIEHDDDCPILEIRRVIKELKNG